MRLLLFAIVPIFLGHAQGQATTCPDFTGLYKIDTGYDSTSRNKYQRGLVFVRQDSCESVTVLSRNEATVTQSAHPQQNHPFYREQNYFFWPVIQRGPTPADGIPPRNPVDRDYAGIAISREWQKLTWGAYFRNYFEGDSLLQWDFNGDYVKRSFSLVDGEIQVSCVIGDKNPSRPCRGYGDEAIPRYERVRNLADLAADRSIEIDSMMYGWYNYAQYYYIQNLGENRFAMTRVGDSPGRGAGCQRVNRGDREVNRRKKDLRDFEQDKIMRLVPPFFATSPTFASVVAELNAQVPEGPVRMCVLIADTDRFDYIRTPLRDRSLIPYSISKCIDSDTLDYDIDAYRSCEVAGSDNL